MNEKTPRKRATARALLALTLALGLTAIGYASATALAGGTTTGTVSLRSTKLGSILVNSKGHTLYLFAKDHGGTSSCTGTCAKYWPPLVSKAKPTAGQGVKKSLLGTTRRANGAMQVTYNKHPLYMYDDDRRAGQTEGQRELAFGARWYVVSAAGRAIVEAASSGGTSMPTTTTTNPYPTNPYP
jgi:predicted lipoprotein with Yx(FWY)xxD motif